MDLERLAIRLRPRGGWESVDLGFVLVRHWWRPLYGPASGEVPGTLREGACRGVRLLASGDLTRAGERFREADERTSLRGGAFLASVEALGAPERGRSVALASLGASEGGKSVALASLGASERGKSVALASVVVFAGRSSVLRASLVAFERGKSVVLASLGASEREKSVVLASLGAFEQRWSV